MSSTTDELLFYKEAKTYDIKKDYDFGRVLGSYVACFIG
jgi:hypothetical protein